MTHKMTRLRTITSQIKGKRSTTRKTMSQEKKSIIKYVVLRGKVKKNMKIVTVFSSFFYRLTIVLLDI